jgi:hypothetical protein
MPTPLRLLLQPDNVSPGNLEYCRSTRRLFVYRAAREEQRVLSGAVFRLPIARRCKSLPTSKLGELEYCAPQ